MQSLSRRAALWCNSDINHIGIGNCVCLKMASLKLVCVDLYRNVQQSKSHYSTVE